VNSLTFTAKVAKVNTCFLAEKTLRSLRLCGEKIVFTSSSILFVHFFPFLGCNLTTLKQLLLFFTPNLPCLNHFKTEEIFTTNKNLKVLIAPSSSSINEPIPGTYFFYIHSYLLTESI
jgi:hypothetical protein